MTVSTVGAIAAGAGFVVRRKICPNRFANPPLRRCPRTRSSARVPSRFLLWSSLCAPLKTGKTESKHGLTFHYFFVQFVTDEAAEAVLPNRAGAAAVAVRRIRAEVPRISAAAEAAVACNGRPNRRRPNNRAGAAATGDALKLRYIPSRSN